MTDDARLNAAVPELLALAKLLRDLDTREDATPEELLTALETAIEQAKAILATVEGTSST